MLNPLFALSFEAARFGLEMQSVMALRLMRLMGGSEARRSERDGGDLAAAVSPRARSTSIVVAISFAFWNVALAWSCARNGRPGGSRTVRP